MYIIVVFFTYTRAIACSIVFICPFHSERGFFFFFCDGTREEGDWGGGGEARDNYKKLLLLVGSFGGDSHSFLPWKKIGRFRLYYTPYIWRGDKLSFL